MDNPIILLNKLTFILAFIANCNGFRDERVFFYRKKSNLIEKKMGITGFQKLQTDEVVGGIDKLQMIDVLREWKR